MKHVACSFYFLMVCISFGYAGSACAPPISPYGSVIIHPANQGKHQSGSVVLFGCKQGFYLTGSPIITCNGKTWTQTQFKCLGFCPKIRDILNGQTIHVTPSVGKTAVEFHCYTNFRLIGRPRLECIHGRWNGKVPFCEKLKSCAPQKAPANGTLQGNENYHGAQANFACLTGFDLFGSRTLTCKNGAWSGNVPSCKAYCSKIRDPPNGKMSGTRFSHGRVVSFECKPGYKLIGDSSVRCIHGKWNSTVPVCKAMLCSKPTIPRNSYILAQYPRTNKVNYTHGTKVFLACRDGHYLVGSPVMECNQTVWLKEELNCIAFCPALGSLENGIISHVTLKDGGEVEIECRTSYILVGSPKLRCLNGKWNDSLPSCKAPCPEPGVPSNGSRIGDDLRHGKSVNFKCRDDYEREGDATIGCRDGKWIGRIPRCKVISCGDPGIPAHGRQEKVINNFTFGGIVKFKCDKNYTLQGRSSLYCQRNKKWDGDVPKCLASCSDPSHPVNGKTIGSVFEHDSVVKFECLGDRVLQGASMMKCIDGQWNAKLPTCRDCNEGFPLGMGNWCSNNKWMSYFEINLPKEFKITAASIQLGQYRDKVEFVQLNARLSSKWEKCKVFKRPFGEGVEKLVLSQPVITQSLQIKLWTHQKTSICLRAQVYGCEAVPRGCIMQGSAVLFKEGGKYWKGLFVAISRGDMEVVYEGTYKYKTKGEVILDERPKTSELVKGIPVVGEDSLGLLREGKIKRLSSSICTIDSNGEVWQSKLADVRVFKAKLCK